MVFTVYVSRGKQDNEFKCANNRDFFTKILKNYGIIKNELVLIDKKSQKEVPLEDIYDKISVEVTTRHVANGQRPEIAPEATPHRSPEAMPHRSPEAMPHRPPEETPVRSPNIDDLVLKLTGNRVLTGSERKYIIAKITGSENSSPNRKRNREEEVQTANKKLQVQLSDLKICKNAHTQTDKIAVSSVDKNRQTSSVSLMNECKRLAKKEKRDPEKVAELMRQQFDDRRNFILMNNPVVSLVREKYPLLFSLSEVRNEINQIIVPNMDIIFMNNVSKYSEVILSLVDEDDSLLSTINEKIKSCSTQKEKQYAREVGALLILSNVVKEKRIYLHTKDEPCAENTYPRIEAPCKVKNLFYDKYTFRIVVENLLLCEATNFVEAVMCLMASFFIFNISYPDKAFNTFAVMEKIFLEADDTDWNEIDESTNQIIKLIKLKFKSRN